MKFDIFNLLSNEKKYMMRIFEKGRLSCYNLGII